MHREYSLHYYQQQLKEVTEDPEIKRRGAEVYEDEGQAFILVAAKSGTTIRPVLRFDCSNFDLEPPLVEFINPQTKQKLPDHLWPSTVADHQLYGRAICMKETRGYHYHQSHIGDTFDNYRNSFTLLRLVHAILDHVNTWDFPGGVPYENN